MQNNPEAAFRLDNRVALVTGAARGLGAEIAATLAGAGAAVLLTDVLDEPLAATAEELKAQGARVAVRHHDVTDEQQWVAAVAEAVEVFGGLDILVNNAGIETSALFENCELEDFRNVQRINSDGVFLGIKHAIRAMKPEGAAGNGGSIVNLSSVAGLGGYPGLGAYCASKGAVRLLTKAAAKECGALGYGIRVNSIHPAVIKTDMGSKLIGEFVELGLAEDYAAAEDLLLTMQPLGFGTPDDVACCVLYLASPASKWVTGAEFTLDGGARA